MIKNLDFAPTLRLSDLRDARDGASREATDCAETVRLWTSINDRTLATGEVGSLENVKIDPWHAPKQLGYTNGVG